MKRYQIYFKGVEMRSVRGDTARVMKALLDADGRLNVEGLRKATGVKYPSTAIGQLKKLHNIRIQTNGVGKNTTYWIIDGYKLEEV